MSKQRVRKLEMLFGQGQKMPLILCRDEGLLYRWDNGEPIEEKQALKEQDAGRLLMICEWI